MANKTKNLIHRKNIIVICILLIMFVLAACQPTPEAPPMVNRGQGLSEEYIVPPLAEGEKREIDAPRHWIETKSLRNGEIEVVADIDIERPEMVGNIRVLELMQREFTDEYLRILTEYFAKGSRLYKVPKMTKARLKQELEDVKNRVGDYGSPFSRALAYELSIPELIEQAPESIIKEYISAGFDFPVKEEVEILRSRYSQEQDTIETRNTFAAYVEEEGISPKITATKYDPKVGSNSSFAFKRGIIYPASLLAGDHEAYNTPLTWKGTNLEGLVNETWLKEKSSWLDMMDERMDSNNISPGRAQAQADAVLADLGISDLGLFRVEPGIQILTEEYQMWTNIMNRMNKGISGSPFKPGYLFTYYRQDGNLISLRYTNNATLVAPSFPPENISIFVTEDGVQSFEWLNMSIVKRIVAENTRILPFETVKNNFYDILVYTDSGGRSKYQLKNVKLGLYNTVAFNHPDRVWLVPCWYFEYESFYYTDAGGDEISMLSDCAIFNALDGGYIEPHEGYLKALAGN